MSISLSEVRGAVEAVAVEMWGEIMGAVEVELLMVCPSWNHGSGYTAAAGVKTHTYTYKYKNK